MRSIKLDASSWTDVMDFYRALLTALGAPDWHGTSIDALVDSMIWGEINAIDPPYKIEIFNTNHLPKDALWEIETSKEAIAKGRAYFRDQKGHDVDVSLEIVS